MENMRRWLPPGVSRGWGPQSDSHKELKSASERHEAGAESSPDPLGRISALQTDTCLSATPS